MSFLRAWRPEVLYLAIVPLTWLQAGAQTDNTPNFYEGGTPESSALIYEPYDTLPTSPWVEPNNFTSPIANIDVYDILDEGLDIEISWDPPVEGASLFAVSVYDASNFDIGSNHTRIEGKCNHLSSLTLNCPRVLISCWSSDVKDNSSADWTLSCGSRCDSPFTFIVATTASDGLYLLFASRLFWIRSRSEQESADSTTTTPESTSITSSSSSSSQESTSTSTTSDSTTTTTSSMNTIPSAPRSSPSDSTSIQSSSDDPSAPALADETETPTPSPRHSSAAAIGGGVGGGVGGLLLLVGAFFLWRHYRNKAGGSKDVQQYPEMESL